MCGQRLRRGSRSIGVMLLLVLLLSGASLQADALSEIQEILISYEQITLDLGSRLKASELNTSALSISIGSMNNSLMSLQASSKLQAESLDKQEISIAEMQRTLTSSDKQINDLQTGYLKMERNYKIMKTVAISTFSIAIASIALNVIMLL